MFRFLMLSVLGLCVFALPGQARPVSYPGGVTVMTMNNGDRNSLHIHYSPTAFYSVGYLAEYWRESETTLQMVQVNNLLKRWNNKDSQANLYLKSGIGAAYSDYGDFDHDSDMAAFTGIAADWESRRFFVSYSNRYNDFGEFGDFYMQSGRVGIAPYIGDYGDLHTWLMLEIDHNPESSDPLTYTPMVRFFKDVHLVEAGMSDRGEVLFNYVVRF